MKIIIQIKIKRKMKKQINIIQKLKNQKNRKKYTVDFYQRYNNI